ncbi:IclR family transcriptional regulator [Sphingomonas sp. DT-204]
MLRRTVKSASRTLEVFELFAEQRRPLRLHEIYTALDYPQSSATNLLKSLVVTGYVNYNRATRTYLPTMRVGALGSWLPGYIYADDDYRWLVEELQRRTDETVALITQNDLFVQYVLLRAPEHEFKMVPPTGTMRLLVDSAAGLALMSEMKDSEIDKLCRYSNYYQLAEGRRFDSTQLMRDVRWARQTGYVFMANKPHSEVSAIAMPLAEKIHEIPLAIGVGGLAPRISKSQQDIVRTMRACIAEFRTRREAHHYAVAAE